MQPCTPSVRRTQYSTAFGTAVQVIDALRTPALAFTTGFAVGAGVATQPRFEGAGARHAMPWRRNAFSIATMCGVPFAREPSSSSAARKFMYQLSALQPPLRGAPVLGAWSHW